jgi:hypothetical protein
LNGIHDCTIDRIFVVAQVEVDGGPRRDRVRPFEVDQRLGLVAVAARIGTRQDLIDGLDRHAKGTVEQRHGRGKVVGVADDRDAVAGAVGAGIEDRCFVVESIKVARRERGHSAERGCGLQTDPQFGRRRIHRSIIGWGRCCTGGRLRGTFEQRFRRVQVVEPVDRGNHTLEACRNLWVAGISEVVGAHGH